jgi:predicted Fe-S protein YdhL (DUF1289 family)
MSEPIASPCRQICRLGDDRRCDGCGRTLDEIARWSTLSPAERRQVMQRVKDWTPRPPNPADER